MPEIPEHLKAEEGLRGFAAMPLLLLAGGARVRVYESSNADGPHVWLHAMDGPAEEARVELTAEEAWRLAEQLMTLARNHYQGDSRPAHSERAGDLLPEVSR